MFRTRLAARLVGTRPLGGLRVLGGPRPLHGLRFTHEEAKQPSQPITQLMKEPTKWTKDRLWKRLSEVEARFSGLLKATFDFLNIWELSALTAAAITICGVILYFVDKWEKHWPAAVVAILVEQNLVLPALFHHPTDSTTEAPAPAPAPPAMAPIGK
ncbi:hypothetical protein HOY82DRAFT_606331 [Tuber indicum]|nr:hypothetical protein HOY82DRAFT_606331 [Tuber indicum]